MRAHRRDDLRKSHLAFPDEGVKSIRSVPPSFTFDRRRRRFAITLHTFAAFGLCGAPKSLSAPREIYAQRSAFDTVLPCKAARRWWRRRKSRRRGEGGAEVSAAARSSTALPPPPPRQKNESKSGYVGIYASSLILRPVMLKLWYRIAHYSPMLVLLAANVSEIPS